MCGSGEGRFHLGGNCIQQYFLPAEGILCTYCEATTCIVWACMHACPFSSWQEAQYLMKGFRKGYEVAVKTAWCFVSVSCLEQSIIWIYPCTSVLKLCTSAPALTGQRPALNIHHATDWGKCHVMTKDDHSLLLAITWKTQLWKEISAKYMCGLVVWMEALEGSFRSVMIIYSPSRGERP